MKFIAATIMTLSLLGCTEKKQTPPDHSYLKEQVSYLEKHTQPSTTPSKSTCLHVSYWDEDNVSLQRYFPMEVERIAECMDKARLVGKWASEWHFTLNKLHSEKELDELSKVVVNCPICDIGCDDILNGYQEDYDSVIPDMPCRDDVKDFHGHLVRAKARALLEVITSKARFSQRRFGYTATDPSDPEDSSWDYTRGEMARDLRVLITHHDVRPEEDLGVPWRTLKEMIDHLVLQMK